MTYALVLLPGDGIGPEVMREATQVLDVVAPAFGLDLQFREIPCGGRYFLSHGRDWPEGAEHFCKQADAILLGAVGWPAPDGSGPVCLPDGRMAGWSPVLGNRARLDLYANIRPVRALPGIQHRIHGRHHTVWRHDLVNLVIVRENTEGLYANIGGFLQRGSQRTLAIDNRVVTRDASARVIRAAFELAQRRGHGAPRDRRMRVTCVAKHNVLHGCQLFVEVFHQVAGTFPDVDAEVALLDAFAQSLVSEPERYDVCVTTNLFGDVLTDLAAVMQGGMGMAVGCNIGDTHAMFEPVHGSAPDLTDTGRANPLAMILAASEALRWLGGMRSDARLTRAASVIADAVAKVVLEGVALTPDLARARASTTSEVGDAVRAAMRAALS